MRTEELKNEKLIPGSVSSVVTYKSTFLIENTVALILEKYLPDTIFLAAVSGGADSMAMLAALSALTHGALSISKDRLFCLHIEHGLRPAEESQGDAECVRDYCKRNGISCTVVSLPPGKVESFARSKKTGIEAAARFFRHKALFKKAKELAGPEKKVLILTAHTKDDALELALMRVLRGAGPAGLAAMPVCRGRFLRPLLSVSREEVIRYLKEKNISWRNDATNAEDIFLRNKIRLRLIPFLNEFFPSWEKGLAGMAETQSLVSKFLKKEIKKHITWEPLSPAPHTPFPILVTDEKNFFSMPQIIREEALFRGIDLLKIYSKKSSRGDAETRRGNKKEKARIKSIKRVVVRKFCAASFACAGSANAVDLGPVMVKRKGGKVVLSNQKYMLETT